MSNQSYLSSDAPSAMRSNMAKRFPSEYKEATIKATGQVGYVVAQSRAAKSRHLLLQLNHSLYWYRLDELDARK